MQNISFGISSLSLESVQSYYLSINQGIRFVTKVSAKALSREGTTLKSNKTENMTSENKNYWSPEIFALAGDQQSHGKNDVASAQPQKFLFDKMGKISQRREWWWTTESPRGEKNRIRKYPEAKLLNRDCKVP